MAGCEPLFRPAPQGRKGRLDSGNLTPLGHDLVLRLDRGLLCIQDPGLSAAHAGHRSGKVRIFRGG
jgi:hypothetical protein